MNTKFVVILALAAGLVAGSLFMAQAQTEVKPPPPDPRIDKLIDQNEQILKNQDQIIKTLGDLKEGVLQLRRRSS
ncbi:MAG TPA: hypothetical protein VMV72_12805 [Verrucomicrobiae bacterium]|nr:hypothetical protein [Verrucomicrobiae bacterium]